MSDLINGRTPEKVRFNISECANGHCLSECPYDSSDHCVEELLDDALALIERLESDRDAAILDLKAISHCYTCSNRDLDENWVCKNSGGGGVPFSQCPGYVWDKKLHEPPEVRE